MTAKLNFNLSESFKKLENTTANVESSIMNLILSSTRSIQQDSEYYGFFNFFRSDSISKAISEGKYSLALRNVLAQNDSSRLFTVLNQIPHGDSNHFQDLSFLDTFNLVSIFKSVIEEGSSNINFSLTLFWLYEILIKFESFVESISPYRSPTSSIGNLSLIEDEKNTAKLRSDAQEALCQLSKEQGLDGNLVALFESLSVSFQRNVIQNISTIVASSAEKIPISERKLRLTNRIILSLQVGLDKLLNDDY